MILSNDEKDELLQKAMLDYGDDLIRLAFTYTKDHSRAEDIVQDSFINFYIHIDQFRYESSVKTYIYRIVINQCHNYLRSWAYRKIELREKTLNIVQKSMEKMVLDKEFSTELANAISKLPPKYREVLWCYYMEEFSIKEIAEMLNTNENTVKTRLVRARNKAKIIVKEDGIYEK